MHIGWTERENTAGMTRTCDYGPFTLVVRPQPHNDDWTVAVIPSALTSGPGALLAPRLMRCDTPGEAAAKGRQILARRLRELAALVEST